MLLVVSLPASPPSAATFLSIKQQAMCQWELRQVVPETRRASRSGGSSLTASAEAAPDAEATILDHVGGDHVGEKGQHDAAQNPLQPARATLEARLIGRGPRRTTLQH